MASKLKKKKKRTWDAIGRTTTIDYTEALKDPGWDNERRWADSIIASNRRLGLAHFKIVKLTIGNGSCFPIAVIQQLNREDVIDHLSEELRELARSMDYHLLRKKVKDFICSLQCRHPKVLELKDIFYNDQAAKVAAGEPSKTWEEYWESMLVDTEWADGYFIQATAWYLKMVIQIMDTKCTVEEPYYRIDGDFDGEGTTDILYIGYVSEVHYQALLIDHTEEICYSDEDNENDALDAPSPEDNEDKHIDDATDLTWKEQ